MISFCKEMEVGFDEGHCGKLGLILGTYLLGGFRWFKLRVEQWVWLSESRVDEDYLILQLAQ
jgi:hypothetical protein